MKKTIFFLFSIFFLLGFHVANAQEAEVYPVRLYFFHSETCPHCKQELKDLEALKKKYPNLEVKDFEVSRSIKNESLFKNVVERYKLKGYVPVNIIGEEDPIVGYDSLSGVGKEIEKRIRACSAKACPSWLDNVVAAGQIEGKIKVDLDPEIIKDIERASGIDQINPEKKDTLKVRILGKERQLDSQTSIFIVGMILGLADGINPCMFSVLIFLLTYLMAIGSKKKAIKAGIAFALTTFIVYFLFMYGIIKAVDVLSLNNAMRTIVTLFALVAGAIMVKDFFFYGKGISLEIPARFKPTIERLVKKGTLPSAVLLAVLSSIVELPCTSGLPLAYAAIINNNQLPVFWSLMWYNIFFVLPLVVIICMVMFAYTKIEHVEAWREKFKRYMRLVAGTLLLILAYALWKNII